MKKFLSLLMLLLLTTALLLPVHVAADNPVTKEGLYYEIVDGEVVIVDCVESTVGDLVIPAEIDGKPVTAIRRTAFFECVQLASVTIPDTVTTIGDNAFGSCTHLSKVNIPAAVTSVGMDAFRDTAYYNDSKNWDAGLLYIDGCLVAARQGLSTAVINEGTRLIAADAFFGSSIKKVSIPATVKLVGNRAFGECTSLADVYYGGTEADWKAMTVASDNTALEKSEKHYGELLEKPAPETVKKEVKTEEGATTVKTFNKVWLGVSIASGVLAVACAVMMLVNKKKELAAKAEETASEEETNEEKTEKSEKKQPQPKKKPANKKKKK